MAVRIATLCLSLFLFCAAVQAQKDVQKLHVVTGLELTEPQERTKPGIAKVTAKISAKDAKSVEIAWDVSAQFEDADIEFDYEIRDDGRTVQLVIPDSSGVIQVAAVAVVDGKLTDKRHAKTYVVVKYTPRGKTVPKVDSPPPEAKQKAQPKVKTKGKVASIYIVANSVDDDANVTALLGSQGFKNKIKAADIKAHYFSADSADVKALGLDRFVKDAGGTPCILYVTARDEVRKAVKLKPDATAESILAEAQDE